MNSPSDADLMLNVRDGDIKQLGVLFERYHVALYNFFLRMTSQRNLSEDLVQEVFLRMLKYRYTYRGDSKFSTWMYRIARNAWIDQLRKQKSEESIDGATDQLIAQDPLPSEQIETRQEIDILRAALARLPEEKREVLILSRFNELKYAEIAEIMDCTVSTVKVRVHRAIKELREMIAHMVSEPTPTER